MPANLTIDDIAEALGVSKTTVSRAISGKGRISKETTDRVRAYIEEHNYKPNVYAQGLAKQCTRNIGVIWPSDTEAETLPFFQKCLLGINKVTAREGYDLLLTITSESEDETEALRRIVENHKVDGIILTRTLVRDAAADYLQEAGIPFVSIGNCEDPQRICVDNENELASFYDSALLEHAVPAVTSVQFDDAALGAAAAQTLLALLRGEVVESQYLSNYRIQLRETVY